jgi:hypothetical protein
MASTALDKVKEAANANTGLGMALGGVMGAVFGGPMGAAIGATIGGAIAHTAPKLGKAEMTAQLKLIYEDAMTQKTDPAELRELATSFEREGFRLPARMLRARADLRELPDEDKQVRRRAIALAMASDNPDLVDDMAQAFEDACALDAAKACRTHAAAVRAAVAAGQSAKPAPRDMIGEFTKKLKSAIQHFGATSEQAQTAAANLIRARGGTADESSVAETIGENGGSAEPAPATPATPSTTGAPAEAVNPPEPVAMPDAVAQIATAAESMAAQIPGGVT